MPEDLPKSEVRFSPRLGSKIRYLLEFSKNLQEELDAIEHEQILEAVKHLRLVQDQARTRYTGAFGNELYLAENILLDLACAGWRIKLAGKVIMLLPVDYSKNQTISDAKEAVRQTLRAQRDEQIRTPSVQRFLTKMETYRLGPNGWHSIQSVMRDGVDLHTKLKKIDPKSEVAFEATRSIIRPYIQFVERGKRCDYTGLKLSDIWRYFRHTWLTSYKSVPGRNFSILIRDAATPCHAIIGIAALGNSVMQLDSRDRFIGWHPDQVIEWILGNPTSRTLRWLEECLSSQISELYIADLIREGVIARRCLRNPSSDDLLALTKEAEKAKKRHRLLAQRTAHKAHADAMSPNWKQEAETNLFRAKRCQELASLLRIRQIFNETKILKVRKKDELLEIMQSHRMRTAIRRLSKKIKATRAGINIMDLIVCGAVAPYNHLLGGKLVSMLMASPELTRYYMKRYKRAASVIASSMRGREVVREPRLVFLGTTSLFGSGASQYNRVAIPVSVFGRSGNTKVAFQRLGSTEGFGSVQFSQRTVSAMSVILNQGRDGRRVNSIFGEGVSPLFRKIREGLDIIGLESDELIRHRNKRIIYGVQLIENLQRYLLGISRHPKYLVPQDKPKYRTEQIVDYWRQRWLVSRLNHKDAIEALKAHSLEHPQKHGGLVSRPTEDVVNLDLPFDEN